MDHARGRNSLRRISNPLFEMCLHRIRSRCRRVCDAQLRDTIHDSGLAFFPPPVIHCHLLGKFRGTNVEQQKYQNPLGRSTVDRRPNRELHNSSPPDSRGHRSDLTIFNMQCTPLYWYLRTHKWIVIWGKGGSVTLESPECPFHRL